MTEYANGADGRCQECGEPTEEEHHALCMDCWRSSVGWQPYRADGEALAVEPGDLPNAL